MLLFIVFGPGDELHVKQCLECTAGFVGDRKRMWLLLIPSPALPLHRKIEDDSDLHLGHWHDYRVAAA